MRRLELKKSDLILLAFFLALFCSSLALYVQNFPLKRYLFDLPDEEAGIQIGEVQLKQGTLIRELLGDAEFKPLEKSAPVFSEDTVVTGPDSTATLTLDDGGTIELGPNTMIKLSFENDLSLDGISRAAKVKVVTGNVTGQANTRKIVVASGDQVVRLTKRTQQPTHIAAPKPVAVAIPEVKPTATPKLVAAIPTPKPSPAPSPSPSPAPLPAVQIRMLAPAPGALLAVDAGSPVPEKKVAVAWSVEPANFPTTLVLRKLGPVPKEVSRKEFPAGKSKFTMAWMIKKPGKYEWEVIPAKGTRLDPASPAKSTFVVPAEYEAIETLDALVAGNKMVTNRLNGERLTDFDLTFQWKPYATASGYKIQFHSNPELAGKPLFERELKNTNYTLNKGKVFAGKLFYRVSADLPSGFRVFSKPQAFMFDFLPPALVIPRDRMAVRPRQGADNSILMTWQKTNFTDSYELEVASDPTFQKVLTRKKLPENFFVLKLPPPGNYWWRVKSFSGQMASPTSVAHQFQISGNIAPPLQAPKPASAPKQTIEP